MRLFAPDRRRILVADTRAEVVSEPSDLASHLAPGRFCWLQDGFTQDSVTAIDGFGLTKLAVENRRVGRLPDPYKGVAIWPAIYAGYTLIGRYCRVSVFCCYRDSKHVLSLKFHLGGRKK